MTAYLNFWPKNECLYDKKFKLINKWKLKLKINISFEYFFMFSVSVKMLSFKGCGIYRCPIEKVLEYLFSSDIPYTELKKIKCLAFVLSCLSKIEKIVFL